MDEPIEVRIQRIRKKAEEVVNALYDITLSDGDKLINEENYRKLISTYPTGVFLVITTQSKVYTTFMGINNWEEILRQLLEIMYKSGEIMAIPIPIMPFEEKNNNSGVV